MRRALHRIRTAFAIVLAMVLFGAPQIALAGHYLPPSEGAKAVDQAPVGAGKFAHKKHQHDADGGDGVDGGHEHDLSVVSAVAILSAAPLPDAPPVSRVAPSARDPDSLLPRPSDPPPQRPPSAR